MANWSGLILTDLGRALHAKVEAGKTKLTLTKFKLGNGTITGSQTLEGLTDLVSPKQIIGINTCEPNENGLCTISGVVINLGLKTGYELKELGVFANDPDRGEILYAITIDTHSDYLQPEGGATVVSEEFHLNIAISNTQNVTAVIDMAGLATIGNVNTLINQHNTDEKAHQNIKANSAKVADKLVYSNNKQETEFSWEYGDGTPERVMGCSVNSPNKFIAYNPAAFDVNYAKISGDADTVDGKHANDFAPAGFGLGEYQVPPVDPDKSLLGGIYRSAYNPSGVPDNTMMLTMGLNADYTAQFFIGMNTNRAFLRTRAEGKQNGLLREFAMMGDIPSSLPAKGGDADTVDGYHAADFATADAHANKANCNADNFTNAGKKVISNLSMPSNTFETLGTLSNTFVAPANGYYYIVAEATASNSYIGAINLSANMASVSHGVSATTGMNAYIPAKKGDNVKFSMQFVTNLSTKFIYAEGEI